MKSFKKLISLTLAAVMTAATLPMSALAADSTKAVKEDIDWENWLITDAIWSSHLDGTTYYVDNGWWCSNAMGDFKMNLEINDNGCETSSISAQSGYTSDGVNWGYKGTKYYTGWLGAEGARVNEFPADRWLGVKDISAHKDTGYAVFTIENVKGDAENAYLAITGAPMDWDVEELVHRMLGNALVNKEDTNAFPITPEKYPVRSADQPFKDFYNTKIVGVSLTDYYNVAKGGRQTVAVPLSRLVNAPDFNEVTGGADEAGYADRRNMTFDLRLFGGMGIAKKDSGSQKTFSATITDLAIVDPKKPENLMVEQDGEYVVAVFDTTTDSDVSFKLKKTYNGIVEYIDAPEGVAEDTIDPSKSYMYQAVAVADGYGIEVASEPVFIGNEGVDILKAEMDWKNWVGEGGDAWHNYMEGDRYFIGDLSIYNNSMPQGYDLCAGGNMTVKIDDSNSGTEYKITSKMYDASSQLADVPNVDGLWGYKGMNYNQLRSYPNRDAVSDDVWFGIKNIKDWENSGYAVFTINSVAGDAENAFLAITTLTDQWQLPTWAWDQPLPITKADYADKDWNFEHGMALVAGAKLTDYYDVAKGGVQTVAVPLSKLVNDPDLEELQSKSITQITDKFARDDFEYTKAELYLFTGMGIAKRDAKANKSLQVQVSEMKIVGLQDPTNLVGTKKADGSVAFTFDTTSDIGVSYKIAKTVDGKTTYHDAPGGAFTDNNVDSKKSYEYKAVAYSADYGIYSAGSEPVVIAPNYESVVRVDFDWKNWVDPANPWRNLFEDETYFYGTPGIYNDYAGGHTYFAGADAMPVGIDDVAAGTDKSIATQIYKDGALTEIPNKDGFWGYSGLNLNRRRALADKSSIPADEWFGVKSLKNNQDSGYAVFTITEVTGDAENAYLAITTLPDSNQIPAFALDNEVSLPITKDENKAWGEFDEHYVSVVTGVKLTDYYDVAAGGTQTVKVPLSAFVEDPEFMEFRSKDYNSIANRLTDEFLANFVPELHLFTGMGIAKRDSGEAKTFRANITEAKVVGIDAPTNFEAALDEEGNVAITFETTFDKDAIFKVKRVCGNEVVYFDAQDGTYVDDTRDSTKEYKYSAVAQNSEYELEAESDVVVIEAEVAPSYAKLFADGIETKYVKEGTMTAKFYSAAEDATGYIARYNNAGKLLGANLVAAPAGVEVSVALAGVTVDDTVKVMLWADAEPIADMIVAAEKPLTVLYIGDEAINDTAKYVSDIINVDMSTVSIWGDDNTIGDHVADLDSIEEELMADEWDYIFIQEDMEAVNDKTAYQDFEVLYNLIAETEPNAEVYVVDGWCYSAEAAPDGDAEVMFANVSDATSVVTDYVPVITTSTAIFLAAFEYGLDVWAADGKGLNDTGAYAASMMVAKAILGDVSDVDFAPSGVDAEAIKVIVADL